MSVEIRHFSCRFTLNVLKCLPTSRKTKVYLVQKGPPKPHNAANSFGGYILHVRRRNFWTIIFYELYILRFFTGSHPSQIGRGRNPDPFISVHLEKIQEGIVRMIGCGVNNWYVIVLNGVWCRHRECSHLLQIEKLSLSESAFVSADGSWWGDGGYRGGVTMELVSHVSVHHIQQKVHMKQPFLLFDSLFRPSRPLGQLQYCWWETVPAFPCL